jgi:hypothetical protein
MAHQSGTAFLSSATGVENFGGHAGSPHSAPNCIPQASTRQAIRLPPLVRNASSEFTVSREARALTIISYTYRFVSNFAFLAVVYFTLNFLTKYEERTIIATLVLAYSVMRVVSALRQFHFFSRIERLEAEARNAVTNVADSPMKKQAIREVSVLRHQGELKAYMDLLFLGLITLLCIAKIVGG